MLSDFVIGELFAFLLLFCRLGSAIMLLPGFGEAYVLGRARLFIALGFSILLVPVIHNLPPVPRNVPLLIQLIAFEILIGAFIGGMSRMLISTLHVAGSIIAYQSSLSSSLTQNIAGFQGQDSTIGNLLSMAAVILIFVTDTHHLMLRGLAESYTLFIPGEVPIISDFAKQSVLIMSGTFHTALQIAAPNIVVGLMLYLGGGILARLMPNMQIFFILTSPQMLINFFILMICFSSIMLWYLDYFRATLTGFLAPAS